MKTEIVYLRMRQHIRMKENEIIRLGDLAELAAPRDLSDLLAGLTIHKISRNDEKFVVIDVMQVLRAIQEFQENIDVQTVGSSQTIVEILYPKKSLAPVYFIGVWFLLFIGAGLAIMNFHEDVSMQAVHQKIYKIITGEENPHPLIMQIPYSFGLGIGMILFFNHLFRKRLNEEPSPLEIEMFNYQQDLDRYVIFHEKQSGSKPDDH